MRRKPRLFRKKMLVLPRFPAFLLSCFPSFEYCQENADDLFYTKLYELENIILLLWRCRAVVAVDFARCYSLFGEWELTNRYISRHFLVPFHHERRLLVRKRQRALQGWTFSYLGRSWAVQMVDCCGLSALKWEISILVKCIAVYTSAFTFQVNEYIHLFSSLFRDLVQLMNWIWTSFRILFRRGRFKETAREDGGADRGAKGEG